MRHDQDDERESGRKSFRGSVRRTVRAPKPRVDKGQEPMRIDKFLVQRIENASRNKIQKAIEAGMVLVNNKQVSPITRSDPSTR